MLRRLRIKFVCINMLTVTVMLCIIFGMVFYFTSRNLELQSIQMMQEVAGRPGQAGRPGERPKDIRLPYFTLQQGPRGELITKGSGYYDLTDETLMREILAAAAEGTEQVGVLEKYDLRYCRMQSPVGEIYVLADISSERATLEDLVETCVLISVLSFLAFLGISFLLARWAVKPVDDAWTQQRQFVADASHELKTPLTVIMTNAELLQLSDCNEADRNQFAGNILTMSYQMRGLVESLLDLARIDNGAAKMVFGNVDLSQLVSDGVLPFEPLYFEKGLTLDCQIESGIHLNGSASHLRQVTDILLDNAMKYSFLSGMVSLRLNRQGSHCILSVASPGEPISKEDLKNIFKRFYRVDKVRGMDHSYGLGLSIAESIVREHRGRIWAESANGVNVFYVQLPVEKGTV